MKSVKKIFGLLLAITLMICAAISVSASDIKVKLGGTAIDFDVPPQIINDRTMVPLRAIFEALDAEVNWDADTRTVTSTKGDTTIVLTIDSTIMKVNGQDVVLDSPACIVDDRTLVPVRAISEAFDLDVEWIPEARIVKIKTKVPVPVEIVALDGSVKISYDENGNPSYAEVSTGEWVKISCDEINSAVYAEVSTGDWVKFSFDDDGNILTYVDSSGLEYDLESEDEHITDEDYECESIYDENGNVTYCEYNDDYWEKYAYDDNGNEIYYEDSDGYWEKYAYDDNGNEIYYEDSDGYWKKSAYDESGKGTYYESSDGNWMKMTYNEEGFPVELSGNMEPDIGSFTIKFETIIK